MGRKPLKSESERLSSSAFMPISPLSARLRFAMVCEILLIRMLKRSSSWNNTTMLGEISKPASFLN